FFSSRRRHTRFSRDWSSDVCSSDLTNPRGDFIETEYSDAAPLSIAGENGLRGWAFRSVRFVSASDPAQPGARREAEWKDSGWTRSEGRRVGKGCRCRWWGQYYVETC